MTTFDIHGPATAPEASRAHLDAAARAAELRARQQELQRERTGSSGGSSASSGGASGSSSHGDITHQTHEY